MNEVKMNLMRSKFFACAVSLCLMPSYGIFASANNTKKDFSATLQKHDFVLAANDDGGNINVYCKDLPKKCIAYAVFLKDGRNTVHLNQLHVAKKHQEKGLGSILLQSVIKLSDASECDSIRLLALPDYKTDEEYDIKVARLIKWYKAFGFEQIKVLLATWGEQMKAHKPFILNRVPTPKFS